MKRKLLVMAAALLTMSAAACAQPYGPGYGPGGGPGYGMGPGMMGGGPGYGQGYGPGPGYGMGPGMMGGGYGPGYGMGPGMMGGGYGPGYGMGPGMMGGGYGMGPGMMGGGYGMGPGMMMGGYGYIPDLTAEQRAKIGEIQKEFAQQHWALMGAMHSQDGPMAQAFSGEFDAKVARKAYESMAAAQKQMFESALQMRERVDAVLTKEQREQTRRNWRGGWGR